MEGPQVYIYLNSYKLHLVAACPTLQATLDGSDDACSKCQDSAREATYVCEGT